jgi:predicted lipoprotein with Yx(FWY)xxD motif
MKLGTTVIVTFSAAIAAVLSGYAFLGGDRADADVGLQTSSAAPVSTPLGVTMQPLGKAQGYDLGKSTASAIARDRIAYTDARGLTLYTRDQDPPGASTCDAQCAEQFKPFLAPESAQVFGDWSVIHRPDGRQQWALKGKALYTYVKDVDPGSVGGDSPANYGAPRLNGVGVRVGGGYRGAGLRGAREKVEMPEGWKPALAYPIAGLELPSAIGVKELPDAAAFVLVDGRSHTLYALSAKHAREVARCSTPACRQWRPLRAPQLAEAIGDFTLIERDDGIQQWAYRGEGLYTFEGDLAPGYANGTGVDERWHVAALMRYYMPPSVSIQSTPGQGRVLATAAGMTLYRRDGYILQSGGGHSLRRGQPARPAVGRDIGTDARCDAECAKSWHPFTAPQDAQPSGFWDIATRPDGSKQWVYQGYALWTYDGDKKPGDITGHDTYDIVVPDDPNVLVDVGTPMDGAAALWWSIAIP